MRILFVCLGNICRSPTAEGVMRKLVVDAAAEETIEVESAGTGDWHIGAPPDPRAVEAASRRGLELDGAARQVTAADFERFDLLVAMDRANRDLLYDLAPSAAHRERVRMLREFGDGEELDVPDPYYGGEGGFAEVLEIVERSCAALLEDVLASQRA
jgi:protein-tyrosine phosphatase